MPAVTVNGTGGNDSLVVESGGPDNGAYLLNSAVVSLSGATSFTFNASTGSDTFTIVNPSSGFFGPSGGITFNGGGQPGDLLEEDGGAAVANEYFPVSAGSGSFNYTTREVQRVTVSGSSGTFTLTFNGQTTAPLAINATAAQVQTALDNLSSIGAAGKSVVVDESFGQYMIFFRGAFSDADEPQIAAAVSGGVSATVRTLANGGFHQISFTGASALIDTVGADRPGDSAELEVSGIAGAPITVADGALQRTLVSSTAFTPIQFANKTEFALDAAGNAVILNAPHAAAGLQRFEVVGAGSISQTAPADGVANLVAPGIDLTTNGGAIGTSPSTPLEIDASGSVLALSSGGNIFITDTAGGFLISDVNAASGNVALTSLGTGLTGQHPNNNSAEVTGNVVTLNATGPSTGNTGQIGSFTTSAQFFEVDAHVLNASTNNSRLWISDVGSSVAVGSVNAGNNTAFLRLNGGTMTSQSVDGVGDIVANNVNLSTTAAGGNFGASEASPLEINAAIFTAVTSGPGSVHIRDTASNVSLSFAQVVGGDLTVEVPGRLELKNDATATGNLDFRVGGDFVFGANDNGAFTAGGTLQIVVDADTADPGVGAHLTITNPLSASSIIIAGGRDNDTLTLGSAVTANVSLFGNGGNDTLTGGSGNDTLDGGAGDDTAVYSGARLDYHVDQLANGDLQLIDLRPGSPDGTDTIHAVEHFSFSDGTVTGTALVTPPSVHWSASVDIGTHPAGYQPVGVGDFNHDGNSDALWFNPGNHDVDLWQLSNGHWAASSDIGTHPAGYQPVGVGDFNGDGTSDVLWFNPTTNDTEVWLLSNGHWSASSDIGAHPAGYLPMGVGDFNHDGTSDVLWYNPTTTDTEVWLLSIGHWSASSDIGTHPAGFLPAGVGDFNHDGASDVLWYNASTNETDLWLIANGHWAGSSNPGSHPAGYQVRAVGDFARDGNSDILWFNPTSGDVDIWKMFNGHWAGSDDVGAHPAGSQPVGAGDFDHNGVSDVLWSNSSLNSLEVWLLGNS